MEDLLSRLLIADNETIKQGTAELREAFKKPECVPVLCQLIVSSKNPEIRQYAAILLRKRHQKKYWFKLPEHTRNQFKHVVLEGLLNEPEKFVKNAIAQLVGAIAKHELTNDTWPEILQLIERLTMSENLAEKELGMFTLSAMTDVAPDAFQKHIIPVTMILEQTFLNQENLANPLTYYTILIMKNLLPLVEDDQNMVNVYHRLLPRAVNAIQVMGKTDEYKAIECFELLDDMCEYSVSILVSYVKHIVETCLSMANDAAYGEDLRKKAVRFVGWLAKTKKKSIIKHKLIEPIIVELFNLMATRPEDENEESYFGGEDDNDTLVTSASETLDMFAMNLPPESFIPYLLQHVEPGIAGTDIYRKKAAYLSIAILAEGCSEYLRTKYLETFLRCICQGITDPAPVIRNAALFALGQFSEYLQPDVSKYSGELLPILFDYLHQVCTQIKQSNEQPPSIDRMFYALEMFCENLNSSLLPYLPTLMERLFEILDVNSPIHVRELALSAIGSAANASKENMVPYFEKIIAILNPYLTEAQTEETVCLRIQAVDTLGVLARTVGEQNFAPLATKSLEFGINLLKETNDPDLKKSIYGLFASISSVMKKDMAIALPQIISAMNESVKSSEGVVAHLKDSENSAFPIYEDVLTNDEEEDIENTDNEDDDNDVDDDVAGYSVENAYVEEKEEAVLALKEIAQYTEEAFEPYLETCFEEVFKVVNFPQSAIREAALDTLLQFCITFSKINTDKGKENTKKAVGLFFPRLVERIRLDEEHSVAISAMDTLSHLIKELKSDVLVGEGHKEAIMNCVTEAFEGETECQGDGSKDEIGDEAEQDELLIECAGEAFSNFGKVLPPDEFVPHFEVILPMLVKRLKNASEGQKSFVVGTISECFSGLKERVAVFLPQLLPMLLKYVSDPSDEVRNNAIFGLGELALHGKDSIFPYYMDILQALSNAIGKESHAGARDNIVGAIARLIIANHAILPMDDIFPVFVNQLPLKVDFEENKAVFNSILKLYAIGHAVLQPHLKTLLKVAISILHEHKFEDDESKEVILEFVMSVRRDFPDIWVSLCLELAPEMQNLQADELRRMLLQNRN